MHCPTPTLTTPQVMSQLGKGSREAEQCYLFFNNISKDGTFQHQYKPAGHVTGGLLNRQPTNAAAEQRAAAATAAFATAADEFGSHCFWCGEWEKPVTGTEDSDTHLWCGACKRNRSRKPGEYASELWATRPFTACGPTGCDGCTAAARTSARGGYKKRKSKTALTALSSKKRKK